jgi:DNA-binding XRE family transcriptional regulator
MNQALTIRHSLGNIVVTPNEHVNRTQLKKMLGATLDQYQSEQNIPASEIHAATRERHGDYYRTPGYYLRVYRLRSDLTQVKLAEKAGLRQHHLSEMENNRRPIGKATAKKIAAILDCDYRKLL